MGTEELEQFKADLMNDTYRAVDQLRTELNIHSGNNRGNPTIYMLRNLESTVISLQTTIKEQRDLIRILQMRLDMLQPLLDRENELNKIREMINE